MEDLHPLWLEPGAWGFQDRSGQIVIAPAFEGIGPFADGLAPARLGDRWGYIDTSGQMVIPPSYPDVRPFAHGLAWVQRGWSQSFIDTTGALAIDLTGRFIEAQPFAEGLAAVAGRPDSWGYIDRRGRLVVAMDWETAAPFQCGLAYVTTGKHHASALIDRRGKVVLSADDRPLLFLPTPFARLRPPSEGLAAARWRKSHLWGFIDPSGHAVIDPKLDGAGPFAEGLAPARIGHRWGFIDPTGRLVIEAAYDEVEGFREGLALVGLGCGQDHRSCRYGYIDRQGGMIVEARFTEGTSFSQGLAAIQEGGAWGYIRPDGSYFIHPIFEGAAPFAHGLGAVRLQGEVGLVDLRGHVVFPPEGSSYQDLLAGAHDRGYYDFHRLLAP